ncbi:hypothetical protein GCM10009797_37280 [Nocardioides hwasunensis]
MSVRSLVLGFVALIAILALAGNVGGIGSAELLIWLALVAAWIGVWVSSRRTADADA